MRILLVLPLLISISSVEASVAGRLSKHAATILHQAAAEAIAAKDHFWHTLGCPTGTIASKYHEAYEKYCAEEREVRAAMVGRPGASDSVIARVQSLAMLKDMQPVQIINGRQMFGMNNVISVDEVRLLAIPESSWIDYRVLQVLESMHRKHPFQQWLAQRECQSVSIEGGTREAWNDLIRRQQRLEDLSAAATSLSYAKAGVDYLKYIGENDRARTVNRFYRAMQRS